MLWQQAAVAAAKILIVLSYLGSIWSNIVGMFLTDEHVSRLILCSF